MTEEVQTPEGMLDLPYLVQEIETLILKKYQFVPSVVIVYSDESPLCIINEMQPSPTAEFIEQVIEVSADSCYRFLIFLGYAAGQENYIILDSNKDCTTSFCRPVDYKEDGVILGEPVIGMVQNLGVFKPLHDIIKPIN